jgi:hypothetical protein
MTDLEWGTLISTSAGFFLYEFSQCRMITPLPKRLTKTSELLWINVHPNDLLSKALIAEALRDELGPTIMGVGDTFFHETPEGLVITGEDAWEWILSSHRVLFS